MFDVWERDEKIAICFVFRGCWVWESMSAMAWGDGLDGLCFRVVYDLEDLCYC